jgi:hypothetical protein
MTGSSLEHQCTALRGPKRAVMPLHAAGRNLELVPGTVCRWTHISLGGDCQMNRPLVTQSEPVTARALLLSSKVAAANCKLQELPLLVTIVDPDCKERTAGSPASHWQDILAVLLHLLDAVCSTSICRAQYGTVDSQNPEVLLIVPLTIC